jgi:hypothetical protein
MGTRDIFDHLGLRSIIQAEGELPDVHGALAVRGLTPGKFGRGMSRDAAFVRVPPSYFPDRRYVIESQRFLLVTPAKTAPEIDRALSTLRAGSLMVRART